MKNLFKVITFSFVMLIGMGTLSAQSLNQDNSRPEVAAKKQTAELSKELGLNGDQQRSIFRALVSHKANYKKYIAGKNPKDANVMANKKKHDAVLDKAMKKALTPVQYKKWLAKKTVK